MQQLKLRRMRVRGFKSLADFDLRFPDDLLILVGANGAGKSSVLQALAFIQYFAKGQPKAFFEIVAGSRLICALGAGRG